MIVPSDFVTRGSPFVTNPVLPSTDEKYDRRRVMKMKISLSTQKPQRLGAFEEDSSTETMTGSSRPQVSHKSSSPPAGPPTATGGTLTSSRPTTVTSQSTRVPLSPGESSD